MHAPVSQDTARYPITYIPGIDGVRGLCALGIMLQHTRPVLFSGGLYMEIFFTVSGYLITSVLIKDYQTHGAINLRTFYLRRAARLYPALALMLALFVLASWLFSPTFTDRLAEALISFFYVMNYAYLFSNSPIHYLGHTWSLAVEEQFYLLWPLVFMALLKWVGLTKRLAIIVLALAGAFWLWRIGLVFSGASHGRLYTAFDARADSLLVGCALAIALRTYGLDNYPRLRRYAAQALFPLFMASLAFGFLSSTEFPGYFIVSPFLGSIPTAVTIVALQGTENNFMIRLYESRPAVFCGRLCYGLYVWHLPIFIWIVSWASERYVTTLLLGWPLTFLAALLSYRFIERPFMRLRPQI